MTEDKTIHTHEGMEDEIQDEDTEPGSGEVDPNPDHEPEGTPLGDGDEEPGPDEPAEITI